jgi:hypothetical protein
MDMEMDGTVIYLGNTYDMSSTAHNDTSFNLLVDGKSSTLKVGDMGNSQAIVSYGQTMHTEVAGTSEDSSDDGTYQEEKTYNCIKEEKVTVPAGTFDTYQIRITKSDGSYILDWQSNKAGQTVKSEEYDTEGEIMVSSELTSYKFGEKINDSGTEELLGMSYNSFGASLSAATTSTRPTRDSAALLINNVLLTFYPSYLMAHKII